MKPITEINKVQIDIKRNGGRLGMPGNRGYNHYLVLDVSNDEPRVYLHSGVGTIGTPMHVWHGMGTTIKLKTDVDAEDVIDVLESEDVQDKLRAICGEYRGEEWDGSNMVGRWNDRGEYDTYVHDLSDEIAHGFEKLRTYWDAGEWLSTDFPGAIRQAAQALADGKTLEEWSEDERDNYAVEALIDASDLERALRERVENHPESVEPGWPGAELLLAECCGDGGEEA